MAPSTPSRRNSTALRVLLVALLVLSAHAWVAAPVVSRRTGVTSLLKQPWPTSLIRMSSSPTNEGDEDAAPEAAANDRTSFDQAGQALTEEADQKRLKEMGDFDANPDYQTDSIEQMRAAIRARTDAMGLEKSKVSAEYIRQKQEAAVNAGPPGANKSPDEFGGLDLSKISQTAAEAGGSQWNEDMPSMFYDPEDELSEEEKDEVDKLRKANPVDQAVNELSNAKWPTPGAALREVVVLAVVVAITAVLIISWDQLLRNIYTGLGFIPSKEDLADYASRFDGLDLPSGWTNNMSDKDVAQLADKVQSGALPAVKGAAKSAAAAAGNSLPDL